ncbi:MAG: helix-turn-helix transcriptional regulator [Acidaminococcaceae bacterium]|jgi:DNA-binding HxlR family transcriptional regulator|nr:helix-turn-helix transcriptional regulator [Acidaminococcaceae bacterium]
MDKLEKTYPIEYALAAIAGHWKVIIIYLLGINSVMRYGELKKSLPDITHKMLSASLKDLTEYGVVSRKQYEQIPPKVEYRLTARGKDLVPILKDLCQWGLKNRQK